MKIQLSHSASNRYRQSPRSYYLHYILRLRPEKMGSALFFGSAIDEGLNTLLTNKMNGLKPGDENYINPVKTFLDTWECQNINGVEVDLSTTEQIRYSKADYADYILTDQDKESIESGLNPNWVSLRRKGLLFLEQYEKQIIPQIKKIIAVQKYIKLPNSLGDSFVGLVDFICEWEDGRVYLVDNKTTSVTYKQDSVATSGQLATYFEAVKGDIHVDSCMYITIDKVVRKKKEPKVNISVIKGEISDELIEKTFQEYDETLYGIKMGNFPCSGCKDAVFGCDYRRYCESNGKDLSGLVYVPKSDKKDK